MYPELMANRIEPSPINENLFIQMIDMPRYILHMKYKIRATVAFGRDVFLNGSKTNDLSFLTPLREKLAGTVLDVAKNDGDEQWKVWDCYMYKGEDFRGLPLSKRLSRVELAVAALKSPYVVEAPMETLTVMKRGVFRWSGGAVLLKDLGAPINSRPRNWLVVK